MVELSSNRLTTSITSLLLLLLWPLSHFSTTVTRTNVVTRISPTIPFLLGVFPILFDVVVVDGGCVGSGDGTAATPIPSSSKIMKDTTKQHKATVFDSKHSSKSKSQSSSFIWEATLDKETGVAWSMEQSEPFEVPVMTTGTVNKKKQKKYSTLHHQIQQQQQQLSQKMTSLSSALKQQTKTTTTTTIQGLDDTAIQTGRAPLSSSQPSWSSSSTTGSVFEKSKDIVSTWADFVCKGSVTFGLFHVVTKPMDQISGTMTTTTTETQGRQQQRRRRRRRTWPFITSTVTNTSTSTAMVTSKNVISSLQPRFIPLSLLEFGPVEELVSPYHVGDGDDFGAVWEIPIRGGFLALPPPPPPPPPPSPPSYDMTSNQETSCCCENGMTSSSSSSPSSNGSQTPTTKQPVLSQIRVVLQQVRKLPGKDDNKEDTRGGDLGDDRDTPSSSSSSSSLGKLRFAIAKVPTGPTTRTTQSMPTSSSSSSLSVIESSTDIYDHPTNDDSLSTTDHRWYQLTTSIDGYRPWLAGCTPRTHPVPWIRQQLYLSTQSYVHAYVTWRFHNMWKEELKKVE